MTLQSIDVIEIIETIEQYGHGGTEYELKLECLHTFVSLSRLSMVCSLSTVIQVHLLPLGGGKPIKIRETLTPVICSSSENGGGSSSFPVYCNCRRHEGMTQLLNWTVLTLFLWN